MLVQIQHTSDYICVSFVKPDSFNSFYFFQAYFALKVIKITARKIQTSFTCAKRVHHSFFLASHFKGFIKKLEAQ